MISCKYNLTIKNITLCPLKDKFLKFTKLFYYWNILIYFFPKYFHLFIYLINLFFPFDLWNKIKSDEQNNGPNKPVINTWAKIFLILEKYKNILCSDIFLIKIWEKYSELHIKEAIEQINPYLKCPITILLEILNLPNHMPQKTKPGICVKLLSGLNESKISPKIKPINEPSIDP